MPKASYHVCDVQSHATLLDPLRKRLKSFDRNLGRNLCQFAYQIRQRIQSGCPDLWVLRQLKIEVYNLLRIMASVVPRHWRTRTQRIWAVALTQVYTCRTQRVTARFNCDASTCGRNSYSGELPQQI